MAESMRGREGGGNNFPSLIWSYSDTWDILVIFHRSFNDLLSTTFSFWNTVANCLVSTIACFSHHRLTTDMVSPRPTAISIPRAPFMGRKSLRPYRPANDDTRWTQKDPGPYSLFAPVTFILTHGSVCHRRQIELIARCSLLGQWSMVAADLPRLRTRRVMFRFNKWLYCEFITTMNI